MNKAHETAEQWSLRSWAARHDAGYFPNSEQHRNWKVYDRVPEWLSSRVNTSDTVLEIGCGYGEWMIPLAPHVASVTGIDIHNAPILKARELFRAAGLRNAEAYLSSGTDIPYLRDSFAVVYSISVFQHLPRSIVKGYIAETNRVLVPGGLALHHFRNADNVGPFPPLAIDITVNHTGDFSVGWTAAQVREAGEQVGWQTEVLDLGLFLVLVARKPGRNNGYETKRGLL